MNDFTKEELESMLNWGDVYSEFGQSWTYMITKPLMDKLQSLIDNYRDPNCKHRIDTKLKKCKLCGLPSMSIACNGGYL